MTPEVKQRVVRSGTSAALTILLGIPLGMVTSLHRPTVALAAIVCGVVLGVAAAMVAAMMAPTPALRRQAKRRLMWLPGATAVLVWGGLRVWAGSNFDLVAIALGASMLIGLILGVE